MNNILEIKNVSIVYGNQKQAVKNVTMNVPEQKILAIVGESGSGKSTIIRGVMHLLPSGGAITSGEITFCGEKMRMHSEDEIRRMRGKDMAMIFQDAGAYLNPRRKIGPQFMEMLSVHMDASKSEKRQLALEMLTKMKLPDPERVMKSYPFQLSGGMCQRVAIAMAMSLRPKLLLADEPTSALDVTVQAQVIQEILNLRDTYHTTVIMVTHNIGVASKTADYIGVMKKGELVEFGTRDQVICHPQSDYTKKLLAAVPQLERESYAEESSLT